MNSDKWNKGRQTWAPIIGRIILAFGEIEYCLMLCLGPLDSSASWEKLKISNFSKKASKSIKILSDYQHHPRSRRAIHLINCAIKIAVKRNLIAHNPLNIGQFTNKNGDVEFHLIIGSLRNNKTLITQFELEKTMINIEMIAEELHDIINDIWTEND